MYYSTKRKAHGIPITAPWASPKTIYQRSRYKIPVAFIISQNKESPSRSQSFLRNYWFQHGKRRNNLYLHYTGDSSMKKYKYSKSFSWNGKRFRKPQSFEMRQGIGHRVQRRVQHFERKTLCDWIDYNHKCFVIKKYLRYLNKICNFILTFI